MRTRVRHQLIRFFPLGMTAEGMVDILMDPERHRRIGAMDLVLTMRGPIFDARLVTVEIIEAYYLVTSIEKRFGGVMLHEPGDTDHEKSNVCDLVPNVTPSARLNVDTDYHISPQSDKQAVVKAKQLPSPAIVCIFA